MMYTSIWTPASDTALAKAMAAEQKGLKKGESRPKTFWNKVSARVYAETGEYLSPARCSSRFQYLRVREEKARKREMLARRAPVATVAPAPEAGPRPLRPMRFEQSLLIRLARQSTQLEGLTQLCMQMRQELSALTAEYLPAQRPVAAPQIEIQDLRSPDGEADNMSPNATA